MVDVCQIWTPRTFTVSMISIAEDLQETVDGVARGEWGVFPALEHPGFPVALIHLETGMQLAAFRHGADAMEIGDIVARIWPGLFKMPIDQARIASEQSRLVTLIEASGGRISRASDHC